jgi:hypothetical protein
MRTPSVWLGAITERWRLLSIRAATLFLTVLLCSVGASAYSVLTHEEIVDLLWTSEIRPLILSRYPGVSEAPSSRISATILSAVKNSAT